MDVRREIRRALIPYHFGQRLDLLPNREGEWDVIDEKVLSNRLRKVSRGSYALVVSSDCLCSIPAQADGWCLVWFDAHGDFHTLATTETGNIGGMPLAMLCGKGDPTFMDYCGCGTVLPPGVYHVGGSEFDAGERERMVRAGIKVVSVICGWADGADIHLHIDTDVIRSSEMPASFHPALNGMPLDIFYKQMDLLLPHTQVLSIKTPDPRKDIAGIGEGIVLEIIRRFEDVRRNHSQAG